MKRPHRSRNAEQISVFAAGHDLMLGAAYASRCGGRQTLSIELSALPVEGRLYLFVDDVLDLLRSAEEPPALEQEPLAANIAVGHA